MRAHRYRIGQKVSLIPGAMRMSAAGEFKILALLPPTEGENQYRVKGSAEMFERVVKECDLALR